MEASTPLNNVSYLDIIPDEVFLQIICHLSTSDRLQLIKLSTRTARLCKHHGSLWKTICNVPDTTAAYTTVIYNFLNPQTTAVEFSSPQYPYTSVTNYPNRLWESLLSKMTNVQELKLERFCIPGSAFRFQNLPACLKVLNLDGAEIVDISDISRHKLLEGIGKKLIHLYTVDFSNGLWVTDLVFKHCMELPSLGEIILNGCRYLTGNNETLGTGSCVNLKKIDLTNTGIHIDGLRRLLYRKEQNGTGFAHLQKLEHLLVGEYDKDSENRINMFWAFRTPQCFPCAPNLQMLDISGSLCNSYNLMDIINHYKMIKTISVNFTKVKKQAIQQAIHNKPNLTIIKNNFPTV